MRTPALGITAVYATQPGPKACASENGNTGVDVVSSAWLIGLLEEASHRLVRDLYDPGEGTVGIKFSLTHEAPALPDREVTALARLVGIDGRRLRFEVKAFQGSIQLMSGVHERSLVDLGRFMASVQRQSVANHAQRAVDSLVIDRSPIEFYFDYHSPWCWFASLRIEALATRIRRPIDWRPIHLSKLIESIDGRRPLEANAAFVRWFKQDMQDTAQSLGLALRYHPKFPLRPARALRASVYAARQGQAAPFVQAVMRAYWSEEGDIEDTALLAAIGARCGLPAVELVLATSDEACKLSVEQNTAQAIARGAFGAPSFVCDGRLFWGNDRMDRLEGWAASELDPCSDRRREP